MSFELHRRGTACLGDEELLQRFHVIARHPEGKVANERSLSAFGSTSFAYDALGRRYFGQLGTFHFGATPVVREGSGKRKA